MLTRQMEPGAMATPDDVGAGLGTHGRHERVRALSDAQRRPKFNFPTKS